MNLYQELEEIVEELGASERGAAFRMAYSGRPVSRLPERPLAVFDAEYREEEGAASGILLADLYLPPSSSAHGERTEALFRLILSAVRRRFPEITEISREAARASGGGTVTRCRIVLQPEACRIAIEGIPLAAKSFSVSMKQKTRQVYPIGEGAAALSVPGGRYYTGEILCCALGGAETLKSFRLEAGGFAYEGCVWSEIIRGPSGTASRAVFQAASRRAASTEGEEEKR